MTARQADGDGGGERRAPKMRAAVGAAVKGLPDEAYAAALTALPGMSSRRLGALLRDLPPPAAFAVVAGAAPARGPITAALADPELAARWREAATPTLLERMWLRCAAGGIDVVHVGGPGYPQRLDGPDAPPVLFVRGDAALLDHGRRVAIVGTRNATHAGREAARFIAAGLADAGVHVVSGLARGIDGCAHRAVVELAGAGRPIGVVASGLDVVYPREHRELWQRVGGAGVLVSESPPGTAPEPFRFPLRNRVVAALAEAVVVVESRQRGGSLITARAADELDIPVMAVPGSLDSPASEGTNELLRLGATPVLDASDVLLALDIDHSRAVPRQVERRAVPAGGDLTVYRLCAAGARTVDGIVDAIGCSLIEAAMAVARLEQAGWIAGADGWYQVIGAPLP